MHLGDEGAVQSEELLLQSMTVLPLWLLQILGLAAAAAPTASGALPLAPAASAAITAAAPIPLPMHMLTIPSFFFCLWSKLKIVAICLVFCKQLLQFC